jgi:hypothetical protein
MAGLERRLSVATMTKRTPAALGIITVVAMLASLALGASDEPAATASAAATVSYWSQNSDSETLISLLTALSAGSLIGFGVGLRDVLRRSGAEQLASIAFAGIVVAATGVLTIVSITFTAADTAGKVAPQVTQTLSALNQDFIFPMAAGFGLMLVATGAAAVRTRMLPAWFGWSSILVGAIAITPAGIASYVITPIWIVGLSIWMLRRAAPPTTLPHHRVTTASGARAAIDLAVR